MLHPLLAAAPPVSMHELRAGLVYSALVFGAAFLLGCVRVPFVAPRLGDRWAELVEMPAMAAVILCSARLVEHRFLLSPDVAPRLAVGLLALTSLVATELALVHPLRHQSVGEYVAQKDPVAGTSHIAMLVLYALMPLLLARYGGRRAEDRVKKSLPNTPNTNKPLFLN
jgi:hypothetical protein